MAVMGIDHVQLAMPAGGEDKARAFYSGLLGVREIAKPESLARRGGLWFENGQVRIHLGIEADFRPARKAHPALLIDDLRPLLRVLRDAGHAVHDGELLEGYDRAHVDDPFGNRIELMQRL